MDMASTSEDAAPLLLAFLCVAFVTAATYRYVRNRILHSPEEEAGRYASAAAINLHNIKLAYLCNT